MTFPPVVNLIVRLLVTVAYITALTQAFRSFDDHARCAKYMAYAILFHHLLWP